MNREQAQIHRQFGPEAVLAVHGPVCEPQVSVVMPTYNCLEYLPIAIKSIQKQSVEHVEIIIIDDGSSDNSWRYLCLAMACDARIRAVKLANGGWPERETTGCVWPVVSISLFWMRMTIGCRASWRGNWRFIEQTPGLCSVSATIYTFCLAANNGGIAFTSGVASNDGFGGQKPKIIRWLNEVEPA